MANCARVTDTSTKASTTPTTTPSGTITPRHRLGSILEPLNGQGRQRANLVAIGSHRHHVAAIDKGARSARLQGRHPGWIDVCPRRSAAPGRSGKGRQRRVVHISRDVDRQILVHDGA